VQALVSIHDVTPATLDRVERLLGLCHEHGITATTLLVVPGHDWPLNAIARLHKWQAEGHELAAHGWSHRAPAPRTLYHRLHAAALSRRSGEHLSRSPEALCARMQRSHAWFAAQGLQRPTLYVPPAWALRALGPAELARLPYAGIETLSGVYDTARERLVRLPLVGYEGECARRAPEQTSRRLTPDQECAEANHHDRERQPASRLCRSSAPPLGARSGWQRGQRAPARKP